jgi:catechol 2,3-dioxygenase-like lactoylglutathione lyase family enzyme
VKVTRILHASVNVSGQLAGTDDFYQAVLGLGVTERPDIPGVAGRWFSVGEAQVHLVDAAHRGSGIDPTGPHFCLGVDDLAEAVNELERRSIDYISDDSSGIRQVWICDPAGNTIELQEDRPL